MMFEISRTVEQDQWSLWVAEHFLDGGAALILTGTFLEVISPTNVKNKEWLSISKQPRHAGRTLTTRLHGPFEKQEDADAAAAFLGMVNPPHCGKDAQRYTAARRVVQRPEGRIFSSIRATATTLNLDVSALRKHLNRQPGFRSVKGKEFVYYDDLSPDDQRAVDRMNAALESQ